MCRIAKLAFNSWLRQERLLWILVHISAIFLRHIFSYSVAHVCVICLRHMFASDLRHIVAVYSAASASCLRLPPPVAAQHSAERGQWANDHMTVYHMSIDNVTV